jgi:hypothetical protein
MKQNITMAIIAMSLVATIGTIGIATTGTTAFAGKDSASGGLNKADVNIHQNTGALSKQDFNFHVGTCQGGHSTAVLDSIGGCTILPSPREFHSK